MPDRSTSAGEAPLAGPPPELLTAIEAAGELRVSTRSVHRMIQTGELQAAKIGSQWRIPRVNVRSIIDGAIADHVRRSTAASGVPERLDDPATVRTVVDALSPSSGGLQQASAA